MLPQQNPQPDPSSPRLSASSTPTVGAHRKIAIAVDLSDESAYAVRWAVQNYLRPGDAVILLHVRPTSVLYGADWGSIDLSVHDPDDEESQQKLEDDFDAFTTTKASDIAQPLVDAKIPFKIHIVKDHDMRERLCLEVERLGLSAVIMGSRGIGASKRAAKGRLGSVSDYCVHHCVCPVVVVRFPDDEKEAPEEAAAAAPEGKLHPVQEEEQEQKVQGVSDLTLFHLSPVFHGAEFPHGAAEEETCVSSSEAVDFLPREVGKSDCFSRVKWHLKNVPENPGRGESSLHPSAMGFQHPVSARFHGNLCCTNAPVMDPKREMKEENLKESDMSFPLLSLSRNVLQLQLNK
ncbi:Universal stress protein A [Cinnamomum micranthum f. kanehirae]|uniref:Universal stress protein A n=1 Tax=Cinnamomum micranthum f. kanehirae TaxID=337451 RepID=A0A443PJJ8_9MAGN|nr:Universal stress protein A [Cinnamomum micranthum f. kanehirae]